MSELGQRVEQIMKDEAFQTVLERYKDSLTQIVMGRDTTEQDRADALSRFHGLIGLESELLSEAFNAKRNEQS